MFTEETLEDVGARLEHIPRKSLQRLAGEAGVSKSGATRATQLLKLISYKIPVMCARLAGSRSG
jgi:hypothetical protein